jgi:hypothetical protein
MERLTKGVYKTFLHPGTVAARTPFSTSCAQNPMPISALAEPSVRAGSIVAHRRGCLGSLIDRQDEGTSAKNGRNRKDDDSDSGAG